MKTVIFDFDGTIGDSLPVGIEIVNELADKYGYKKVDLEDLPRLKAMKLREILKEWRLSLARTLIISREVMKIFSNRVDKILVFNGIKAVIDELQKEGYRVGIITKNNPKNVSKILEKAKIKVEFTEADTTFFSKEKAIKNALRKHVIGKEEAVYIGDEVRDIEAAKKAGIPIISVTWGYNSKELLANDNEKTVEQPEDLLKEIQSILP